jgi:hypothetical protein
LGLLESRPSLLGALSATLICIGKIPIQSAAGLCGLTGGILEVLQLLGLVLRYPGPCDGLKLMVARLALVYEQRRLQVTALMSRNAIERMRMDAMYAFADA